MPRTSSSALESSSASAQLARSNKRLTIEAMQQIARERGGLCLSSTYVNTGTALLWQCAQQHQWRAIPSCVKRGSWCRVCAIARSRHALEDMQTLANRLGGKLLSQRYAKKDIKLRWQCASEHVWLATAISVQSGNWCKQCYYDSMRSSIKEMQELAAQRGGKCLSTIYGTAHDRLEWQCAAGHTWSTVPATIRKSWCPVCSFDRKRLGLDKMHQLAAQREGRCLSESYQNSATQLTWQCHEGHIWLAKPYHIQRGHWCPECHRIRIAKQHGNNRNRKRPRFSIPNLL